MNEVERIYGELAALRELVDKAASPSDSNAFETLAAKTLLLAAASYFERQICEAIQSTARSTGTAEPFANFISKQGLDRKYHSLFSWDAPNANKFFSLFGDDCKKLMTADIGKDDALKTAIKDFIYLGGQRNELVHSGFASFSMTASTLEIWEKFTSATRFSDWVPKKLSEASAQKLADQDGAIDDAAGGE